MLPKVLVVDDEPLIAELLAECIRNQELVVVVANTADEGLAVLADGASFDVIITDVRMPGPVSGWDLARKARSYLPAVHVIYATGHGEDDWAHEGVPFSEIVTKPFEPDVVAARVKRLCETANAVYLTRNL